MKKRQSHRPILRQYLRLLVFLLPVTCGAALFLTIHEFSVDTFGPWLIRTLMVWAGFTVALALGLAAGIPLLRYYSNKDPPA